jgi:ketosteroid isomerase-like protein
LRVEIRSPGAQESRHAEGEPIDARDATIAICRAWERSDAQAVAELFADDGRYEDPLFPEVLIGPEAIREGVAAGMAEITGLEIPIQHLAVAGDVAICEAAFLCELTADGSRMDFDFAMAIVVRDGRVVRLTEYFDTRPFVQ